MAVAAALLRRADRGPAKQDEAVARHRAGVKRDLHPPHLIGAGVTWAEGQSLNRDYTACGRG